MLTQEDRRILDQESLPSTEGFDGYDLMNIIHRIETGIGLKPKDLAREMAKWSKETKDEFFNEYFNAIRNK